MTIEQKIILFEGINSLPELDGISKRFKISKEIDKIKSKKPEQMISRGLMLNMEKMFKSQGLSDPEIRIKIKEHIERMKKIEIDNLEKLDA